MAEEADERQLSQAFRQARHPDLEIAAFADGNHGIIHRRRLEELGLGRGQIAFRLRTRRLTRIHRGVYAVGPRPPSVRGRWRAATLVAPGAVLSGRDAAALHDLLTPRAAATEITVERQIRATPLLCPRVRALADDERTEIDGIPVTSVSRTLLDLAATEGLGVLESALRESERRRLGDPVGLPGLLRRYPGARGTAVVRTVLEREVYTRHTRSQLEELFLDLLASRNRPLPLTNQIIETAIGPLEVDCLWPGCALVVELDGWWSHGDREAFERDRRRDAALLAVGRPVTRLTWERVLSDPSGVDAELGAQLGWS